MREAPHDRRRGWLKNGNRAAIGAKVRDKLADWRSLKCAMSMLLTLGLGVLCSESASANLITFNSEADFLNNAPIVSTETFDDFPSHTGFFTPLVVIDQVVYDTDGPCFYQGAPNPCWLVGIQLGFGAVSPPNDFGATFANAITEHRISFGAGNSVDAFGFWFLSGGGFPPPHWEVVVHEIDGTDTIETLLFAADPRYRGFLSDVGINALTVRDFQGERDGAANWSYDNVSRSQVSSIPEPSSISLCIAGFPLVLWLTDRGRFQRRTSTKAPVLT
jgi:hypothetical protein